MTSKSHNITHIQTNIKSTNKHKRDPHSDKDQNFKT